MKPKITGSLIFMVIASATAGCELSRSDSANASRQWAEANRAALAGSKEASRVAAPAEAVTGDALRLLLSGTSHVQEFRRAVADPKPYFTSYNYFAPEGGYISRDTYSRRTSEFEDKGTWRLNDNDNVLCVVVNSSYHQPPDCYALRRTAKGIIQYWIHNPGNEWHGVLTMNVSIVRPGLQTPEYATSREAYGR